MKEYFINKQDQFLCFYGNNCQQDFDKFLGLFQVKKGCATYGFQDELVEINYSTIEYNNFLLNSFNLSYYSYGEWFCDYVKKNNGIIFLLPNDKNSLDKSVDIMKIIKRFCDAKTIILILFCNTNSVKNRWNKTVKSFEELNKLFTCKKLK